MFGIHTDKPPLLNRFISITIINMNSIYIISNKISFIIDMLIINMIINTIIDNTLPLRKFLRNHDCTNITPIPPFPL